MNFEPSHFLLFINITITATPIEATAVIVAARIGFSLKNSIIFVPESNSLASATSVSLRPHFGSLHVIIIESTVSVISLLMADISL